ncbi:hypothetical protein BKA67DRAFT_400161 [Truncatella angustata]|uniref:Uncharacterized protein n=1 Tax=Truncatella angustata TaxID=152316 RepID=A0A9P8RPC0_9PEZI|nr:uncharacterized protein BKA67DRAFT_400161 [Truncatella angustata]KAH6647880.1 hypothetical protein BKA67DRAFT_400161 [Truncatella angustata]
MGTESKSSPDITLEQALEEIKQLTSWNEELHDDLEECRDQLFTLLQKESDVSEQAISDAYSRIFEGLDSWIDEISTHEGFGLTFKSRYLENMKRSKEERSKILAINWVCQDIEWLTKLGKLETCRYVVLALVVTRCLMEDVFRVEDSEERDHIYPFGLSSKEIEFLVQVQEAMASDEIQKDSSQIGRWRRETVMAMISTGKAQERAFDKAARVRKRLQGDLAFWIDSAVLERYMDSLETKVLQRAYRALDLLNHSSKTFIFSGDDPQPGPIQQEFATSTIKDISTWRNMASSKASGAFQSLYLGLVRTGDFDEADLTLVHPTLLGYSSPDMKPRVHSSDMKSYPKQEIHRTDREEREPGSSTPFSRLRKKRNTPKYSSRTTEVKPTHTPAQGSPVTTSWGNWILGPEATAFGRRVLQRANKPKDSATRTQRRGDSSQENRPVPGSTVAYYGPHRSVTSGTEYVAGPYHPASGDDQGYEQYIYEGLQSQKGHQVSENPYDFSRARTE